MKQIIILFAICFFTKLNATIWHVGATQTYTMPSQVSTLVGNGDTVNIDPGTYNSNVCRWTANNLLIRCVNGMAHLKSNGLSYADKGIWVIQGNNTAVDHIEFSLCTSTSSNGAGIRQEGQNLTVTHCYFHDNENGILAGVISPCKITIEYSEFYLNGSGDGFSHNLYIGHVDTLLFRYNYSHQCKVGHELKSRANVNYILYNRLSDEAAGTGSRNIDLPNGGFTIIMGNIIQQGTNTSNSGLIGYGLEGLTNSVPHNLYVINNTIVNERTSGTFVTVQNATALYKAYNNIFAGAGVLLNGAATILDTLKNKNYTVTGAGFLNSAAYDYHLLISSTAINSATNAGTAYTGYPLTPTKEYVHPTNQIIKTIIGLLDIGAYEFPTPTFIPSSVYNTNLLVFIDHDILKIERTESIIAVRITTIDGKLIYQTKNPSPTDNISVSQLSKGLYIIGAVLENGTIINKKILIP